MKIALDNAAGMNVVKSCEPGRVQIRDRYFTASLIVLPGQLLPEWEPSAVHELRAPHFDPVLELGPEILILGTGDTQVFPDPGVFSGFMARRIGFEVMDNSAACRTYNILLSEGRRVVLALMLGACRT